ncbi:MAG: agmatine deiminase family protein [Bacteroidota bacterium]
MPRSLSRRRFLAQSSCAVAGMVMRPSAFARRTEADGAVVVFSAPSVRSRYYAPFFDQLVAFYTGFFERRAASDTFLILADRPTASRLRRRIPERRVLTADVPDIWARDFAPVQTRAGLFKFRYVPSYLPRRDARHIEEAFEGWLDTVGVRTEAVDLVVDGGNVCYNSTDSAVLTERVLVENAHLTRAEIEAMLNDRLGLDRVCLIPEEPGDTTGHADGMVAWLSPTCLAIADLEPSLRTAVRQRLERALPEVEIVAMPHAPSEEQWRGFSDASGIYVNMLATPSALYVPVFDLETDEAALATIEQHTDRAVVPVPVGEVGQMGGSVRCLSWEVTGDIAQRLREAASG